MPRFALFPTAGCNNSLKEKWEYVLVSFTTRKMEKFLLFSYERTASSTESWKSQINIMFVQKSYCHSKWWILILQQFWKETLQKETCKKLRSVLIKRQQSSNTKLKFNLKSIKSGTLQKCNFILQSCIMHIYEKKIWNWNTTQLREKSTKSHKSAISCSRVAYLV